LSIYINEILRIFIGLILLSAAWGKTKTFSSFVNSLNDSFGVNEKTSTVLALIIIIIELVLATGLLIKFKNVQLLMLINLGLFSLFTCVIIFLLIKDKAVSCNCFGEEKHPISFLDLMRNFIFITAISVYLFLPQHSIELSMGTMLLLFFASIILTVLSINFNKIFMTLTISIQGDN